MQVVFRQVLSEEMGREQAQAGELWLRPRAGACAERRDLATLALEQGPAAFQAGSGVVERVVVPANPTLDDMLAATFLEAALEGRPWPGGAAGLARYAALQREGLQPGEVPLPASIEGVFLAQRNAHGDDLTAPAVGERFLADWRRTAAVLADAVARRLDPFTAALFGGADFARERAFLAKDEEVYRQDVLRGERWIVRLPGGPPRAAALLLREPKALLAKQWARRDAQAPVGGTYLLLIVRWGPGHWVVSTDPVQRLSLEPLAQALQAAEARLDASRAAREPWFDGRPFGHTLIASPRAGSGLPEDALLRVVRGWSQARAAPGPTSRRRQLAALGVVALLALGAALLLRRDPAAGATVDFRTRGAPLTEASKAALLAGTPRLRGLALLVGVGRPFGDKNAVEGAAGDVARVYKLLRDRYGFAVDDMLLLSDEPDRVRAAAEEALPVFSERPDRRGLIRAMEALGDRALVGAKDDEQLQLFFYYAGHGKPPVAGERAGYLVLSGFDRTDEPLDMRGYDMGDLTAHLARKVAACRHQLVLLDCCHSGFAIRSYGDYRSEPCNVYDLWRNAAYAVVTAGTEEEKVCDGPQSAFNFVLLEALGGGTSGALLADGFSRGRTEILPEHRDGIVTDAELGVYLESQVLLYCESQKLPLRQTPQYVRGMEQDDVGQILFVPRIPTPTGGR